MTLGFHEIVRQSANNLDVLNESRGIAGIPNPQFNLFGINLDFGLDNELYWWFLLIPAILLAVIMIKHLDNSRVGRYWTAIREDEVAAAAMGVPVTKMKVLAFVIGASTSGVAGWIYAVKFSYIAPNSFPLLELDPRAVRGRHRWAGKHRGGRAGRDPRPDAARDRPRAIRRAARSSGSTSRPDVSRSSVCC